MRSETRQRRSSKIPKNLQCVDPGLSQYYYSRKQSSRISTNDLPIELNARGFKSPWALFWHLMFMVAPLAYIYIVLMLLRDLCYYFPDTIHKPLQIYVPWVAQLASVLNYASRLMDAWCVIEAVFFIYCKLKIQFLQMKDPLEASLSAAPMLDPDDRKILWDRILDCEKDDPISFISGWFFDQPIDGISRHDVCDWICWSMFDGRNQEHLTTEELHELELMMEEFEIVISLNKYGPRDEENSVNKENNENEERQPLQEKVSNVTGEDESFSATSDMDMSMSTMRRPRPKKMFRFPVDTNRAQPAFFSNLYESYKLQCDKYRNMVENADFHPVQDFRFFLAETAQKAEESAMATATSMYETLIQPGSNVDKQLSALSQATSTQLSEAWGSVKGMKERMATATFLSSQRQALMQQLRGNRAMLTRMREMHQGVPSKQMAALMRTITDTYDSLERIEQRAKEGFVHATGVIADTGNAIMSGRDPQRFAKYSSDPLLGIAMCPLGIHLLFLAATEIPLRVLLKRRGFEKRCVGPVSYYFHPGSDLCDDTDDSQEVKKTPIVFVHGIGVGLVIYIPLIDYLIKTGRPIYLPEIPYVSAFRPWLSPNCVLSPAVVASTMTAMLATHSHSRAVFVGHSYGTTWLSYVCKFAPNVVAALLFLDPICFACTPLD